MFLNIISDCDSKENDERKFLEALRENIQNGCDYVKVEKTYADAGDQLVSNPVVIEYSRKENYQRKSGYVQGFEKNATSWLEI